MTLNSLTPLISPHTPAEAAEEPLPVDQHAEEQEDSTIFGATPDDVSALDAYFLLLEVPSAIMALVFLSVCHVDLKSLPDPTSDQNPSVASSPIKDPWSTIVSCLPQLLSLDPLSKFVIGMALVTAVEMPICSLTTQYYCRFRLVYHTKGVSGPKWMPPGFISRRGFKVFRSIIVVSYVIIYVTVLWCLIHRWTEIVRETISSKGLTSGSDQYNFIDEFLLFCVSVQPRWLFVLFVTNGVGILSLCVISRAMPTIFEQISIHNGDFSSCHEIINTTSVSKKGSTQLKVSKTTKRRVVLDGATDQLMAHDQLPEIPASHEAIQIAGIFRSRDYLDKKIENARVSPASSSEANATGDDSMADSWGALDPTLSHFSVKWLIDPSISVSVFTGANQQSDGEPSASTQVEVESQKSAGPPKAPAKRYAKVQTLPPLSSSSDQTSSSKAPRGSKDDDVSAVENHASNRLLRIMAISSHITIIKMQHSQPFSPLKDWPPSSKRKEKYPPYVISSDGRSSGTTFSKVDPSTSPQDFDKLTWFKVKKCWPSAPELTKLVKLVKSTTGQEPMSANMDTVSGTEEDFEESRTITRLPAVIAVDFSSSGLKVAEVDYQGKEISATADRRSQPEGTCAGVQILQFIDLWSCLSTPLRRSLPVQAKLFSKVDGGPAESNPVYLSSRQIYVKIRELSVTSSGDDLETFIKLNVTNRKETIELQQRDYGSAKSSLFVACLLILETGELFESNLSTVAGAKRWRRLYHVQPDVEQGLGAAADVETSTNPTFTTQELERELLKQNKVIKRIVYRDLATSWNF